MLPGLGNSGPEHWQGYFEKSAANFKRIEQSDWDTPACKDWVENTDNAISGLDPKTVVLIGHSLGCIAIANWAKTSKIRIKGALLVAPSDVEAPRYTFDTVGFESVPLDRIGFKTIVVASTNDEWISIERAAFFAENWGSEFINIGEAGHINAASGFGEWKEGLELLKSFK
ncbi:RBBP9/YdeN family alpha/beta hydrolase [Pedobacter rhodius]|uniref:Alpha/beta hydrolase n=1 Tax=Pedobacter rhodius TaxID=3004098 RepID=A0ABT4L264_9SPHI|nr:alpha/beta hydrolase [Pedobacter sp. SJ11]MCZ4224158.1 alpha/beta hydrolase [Pedobacter sp. SJ11]